LGGLEALGICVDQEQNSAESDEARVVSTRDSPVAVLVVPTNEEWEIARQSLAVVQS
ncbi:MAG TPA: acetate kinase, partial [Nocardioidaceae bacterium]|nr:acetate kinase [Nocardioidaceae bacterium]